MGRRKQVSGGWFRALAGYQQGARIVRAGEVFWAERVPSVGLHQRVDGAELAPGSEFDDVLLADPADYLPAEPEREPEPVEAASEDASEDASGGVGS